MIKDIDIVQSVTTRYVSATPNEKFDTLKLEVKGSESFLKNLAISVQSKVFPPYKNTVVQNEPRTPKVLKTAFDDTISSIRAESQISLDFDTKNFKLLKDYVLSQEPDMTDRQMDDFYYAMNQELYKTKPVYIDEFIFESYREIYPFWMEHLKDIYPSPYVKTKREIHISGAIGIGKTLVPVVGILYEAYLLSNMKNPQRYFSLMDDTKLLFLILNPDSSNIGFDYLESLIRLNPFINKLVIDYDGDCITLCNKIKIMTTSRIKHSIGQAIVSCFIDFYSNFYLTSEKEAGYKKLAENYNSIDNRINARFQGHSFSGSIFLTSYPKDEVFIKSFINYNDPTVKAITGISAWEVKSHINRHFSGNTFKVSTGDGTTPPRIVDEPFSFMSRIEVPTIKVPVEYKKHFEDDIYYALSSIAGIYVPEPDTMVKSSVTPDTNVVDFVFVDKANGKLTLKIGGQDIVYDLSKFAVIDYKGEQHGI